MAKKIAVRPIEEYQISQLGYWLANIPRVLSFGVGIYITKYIIYDQCLFNPNANIVATIFFSLLALFCFDACGMQISQFMNVVVKNAKEVSK